LKEEYKEEDVLARKNELVDPGVALETKKTLLVQMASVPSPEVYRVLESYANQPDEGLEDWAKMALQESKLLLESHLLDDRQVFISTGLGGKGNKLRYFVVLFNKTGDELQPFQQKVLRDEISYALQRYDSELESLKYTDKYTTMLIVAPITSDIARMFREGIDECNQFGDFLSPDFIVTNMKELSEEEINEAISASHPVTDDDFPPVE
jgi:hypothetical protein